MDRVEQLRIVINNCNCKIKLKIIWLEEKEQ